YKRIANDALPPADTWEVALSTGQNKREAWERLLVTHRLPDGALLKNLRNMREAGVDRSLILHGLDNMRGKRLLPIDFLRAAKAAPEWEEQLERTMYRVLANRPKLHGRTLLIVDVSGSMSSPLSSKSEFTRMDAACAMAILARELCEDIEVYTTAGNDGLRIHST